MFLELHLNFKYFEKIFSVIKCACTIVMDKVGIFFPSDCTMSDF